MSVQLKPSDKIKQVDPVWDAVRANAKGVVADEPALAAMVMAHVLNQPNFESALISRISERLGDGDVSAELIRQAFQDALLFRPEIAGEARRWLAPGGALVLEIGGDQGIAVHGVLAAAGLSGIKIKPDHSGHDRIALARV